MNFKNTNPIYSTVTLFQSFSRSIILKNTNITSRCLEFLSSFWYFSNFSLPLCRHSILYILYIYIVHGTLCETASQDRVNGYVDRKKALLAKNSTTNSRFPRFHIFFSLLPDEDRESHSRIAARCTALRPTVHLVARISVKIEFTTMAVSQQIIPA